MEPHEIDAIHEALGHVRDRLHAKHLLGKFGKHDEQETDKGTPAVLAIKVDGDGPGPLEKLEAEHAPAPEEAAEAEHEGLPEEDEDPRGSHFKLGHMGR